MDDSIDQCGAGVHCHCDFLCSFIVSARMGDYRMQGKVTATRFWHKLATRTFLNLPQVECHTEIEEMCFVHDVCVNYSLKCVFLSCVNHSGVFYSSVWINLTSVLFIMCVNQTQACFIYDVCEFFSWDWVCVNQSQMCFCNRLKLYVWHWTVHVCVTMFCFFWTPSCFINVSTGLLLIQGRRTQSLCTVHQGSALWLAVVLSREYSSI